MDQALEVKPLPADARYPRPRLGFLGVGWIGFHRLKSLRESNLVEIAAVADPAREHCERVRNLVPEAVQVDGLDGLLGLGLDGMVIATPSARHAEQACAALAAGLPVFCQKPLALTGSATRRVIAAARNSNRLLDVDLSYRYLEGLELIRQMIARGDIGRMFAVDLLFHNAYGPDKPWYYDKRLSGGGCVIDLGTHLVDLMRRVLPGSRVVDVSSQLFAAGRRLDGCGGQVEDYAAVQMRLQNGAGVRLACSWHLQAGREAVIRAAFYGTGGGLCLRNVNDSFYDFQAEHYSGTATQVLVPPSSGWWGAAAVDWARRLAENPDFDAAVEDVATVADILDVIYAAASQPITVDRGENHGQ